MIRITANIIRPIFWFLDYLTPAVDLIARVWVAQIFFMEGWIKINSWHSTLQLFQTQYAIPYFPPTLAAILVTAAELILPILLIIGLGGRLMILIFFIYYLIAVALYNVIWTPEGLMGFNQHFNWGILLAMLMCHGPGKFSVDYWIYKQYAHHLEYE